MHHHNLDILGVQVVEVVVKSGGICEEGWQPREVAVEKSIEHIERLHLVEHYCDARK